MSIKKDFKTGNTTNSLVSNNILTKHTFDFQDSTIFPSFITKSKKKKLLKPASLHITTTYNKDKILGKF